MQLGIAIAFFAMTGITVVGLYVAYIIPVYLRLRDPDFEPGEWNLGRYSKLVGWTSVAWVVFVSLYFFAPVYPPIPRPWDDFRGFANVFNWSGPVMLIVFIVVTLWWVFSAKNWFTGPKVQGTKEELLAIEHALDAGDAATFRTIEAAEEERAGSAPPGAD